MPFRDPTPEETQELRRQGVLEETERQRFDEFSQVEIQMPEPGVLSPREVEPSGRTYDPELGGFLREMPQDRARELGLLDMAPEGEEAPSLGEAPSSLEARGGFLGSTFDFGENLFKGAMQMVGQGISGMGTLEEISQRRATEGLAEMVGATDEDAYLESLGVTKPEENLAFQAGTALRDFTNADTMREGIPGAVGAVGGSLIGFGAMGLFGGPVGAAGGGVFVGAQDFYEDAKREGADEEDAQEAALLGAAAGLSNVVPVGTLLGGLRRSGGKPTQRFLTGLTTNALAEGGQEAFYEWMKNMTARDWIGYDPERSATENLRESAGAGAGAGAFVYSLARLLGVKTPPPPRRTEIEEAERELRREYNLQEDDPIPEDALTVAPPGWSAEYIAPGRGSQDAEQRTQAEGEQSEATAEQDIENLTRVQAFEQAEAEGEIRREVETEAAERQAAGEEVEPSEVEGVVQSEVARMQAERRPLNPVMAQALREAHSRQAAKEEELMGAPRPETLEQLQRDRAIEDELAVREQRRDMGRAEAVRRVAVPDPLSRMERYERENLDARAQIEQNLTDREWDRLEELNLKARGSEVDTPLLRPVTVGHRNRILDEHLSARGRGARSGRFSTGDSPNKTGMRAADLVGPMEKVTRQWRRAAPVRVVQRQRDLPEHIQKAAAGRPMRGVYSDIDKTVYLVARNIDSETEARRVLFHEQLGHKGVRIAGPEMETELFNIYRNHKDEADRIAADRGFDTGSPGGKIEAAEELLAMRAEREADSPIFEGVKRILDRIAETLGIRLRNADLRAILRANRRYMEGRGPRPAERRRGSETPLARNRSDVLREAAERRRETEEATRRIQQRREQLLAQMPKEDQPIDVEALRSDQDRYKRIIDRMRTLIQLGDANPHIEALQQYIELNRQWNGARMLWVNRANETTAEWENLGPDQAQRLGDLLFDQTLAGRWFEPSEFARYGLSERGRQVYTRVQTDFRDFLQSMEEAHVNDLRRRLTGENQEVIEQQIREAQESFQQMRDQPYFPLSRFGRYSVSVRAARDFRYQGRDYAKGELVWFRTYESRRKRGIYKERDIPREIKENGTRPVEDYVSDTQQELLQFPPQLRQMVEKRMEEAGQLTAEQRESLAELAIHLSPTRSFRNRMRRRKGVLGFNEDAMRSYASYFSSGANHLARASFQQPMQESIARVQREADAINREGGAPENRRRIAEWMQRHYQYNLNPENEWAGARAFGFNWYLGFNPRSAATNLTQVPLVTYPYLGARYGDARAIKEITKSYKDVTRYLTEKRKGLSEEEVAFMKRAASEGFIDESMAGVLASVAEGGNLNKFMSASGPGRRFRQFSYASAWLFQKAEQVNRRVTLVATLRLARQRGADPEMAYREARAAVERTQFEYMRWNRPELMRGKKSVLFLFYQHVQNMTNFMLGGDPGASRAWMMYMIAGGLLGLPFAENVLDIIDGAASKLFGKKVDTRLTARERLAKWLPEIRETLGEDFLPEVLESPDLYLRGTSRYTFGYFDFSGSISMGRPVPGTEMLRPRGEWTGYDLLRMQEDVLGAVASIPISVYKAMSSDNPDTWRRLEGALPVMAQSASRALRRAYSGEATDWGGAPIKEYDFNDPLSWVGVAGRALGAEETSIRQQQEADWTAQEHIRYWNHRRSLVLSQYDYARSNGLDLADVHQARKEYNKKVPYPSLRIGWETIRNSMRSRARRRALERATGAGTKREIPVVRDIREAFPEVQRER